ncbi:MAG: hypothetical protein VCC00_13860 [Deltaproteobacteria bacterium]
MLRHFRPHMAAATAYLLVILWALAGLAEDPARLLLLPTGAGQYPKSDCD